MSGSIWVLGLALPCVTVGSVAALKAEAVVLRHRAEGIADRAALAGADTLALRGDAAACPAAALVAATDSARVLSCSVGIGRVRVVVRLTGDLPLAGAVAVTVPAAAEAGTASRLPAPEVPPPFP